MKPVKVFYKLLSLFSLGKVATPQTLDAFVSGLIGKEYSEQGSFRGQKNPTNFDNTTATKENLCRLFVIWGCPWAKKVDYIPVRGEERKISKSLYGTQVAPSRLAKILMGNGEESKGSTQDENEMKGHLSMIGKLQSLEENGKLQDQMNNVGLLTQFPMFPNMKELYVNNNNISKIQAEFGMAFPSLEYVDFSKNNIMELSELFFLRGLKSLSSVSFENNPVTTKKFYRPFILWLCPGVREIDSQEVGSLDLATSKIVFGTQDAPSRLAKRLLENEEWPTELMHEEELESTQNKEELKGLLAITTQELEQKEIKMLRGRLNNIRLLSSSSHLPGLKKMGFNSSEINLIQAEFGLTFPTPGRLDLSRNNIKELTDQVLLRGLKHLELVASFEVTKQRLCRLFIIWSCPWAQKVNFNRVSNEEREWAKMVFGTQSTPSKLAKSLLDFNEETTDFEAGKGIEENAAHSMRELQKVLRFQDRLNNVQLLPNYPMLRHSKELYFDNRAISNLQDDFGLAFPYLEDLDLSRNHFKELGDLVFLSGLRRLRSISFVGNPVTKKMHYRLFVIWLCPTVRKVDFINVRYEELAMAVYLFGHPDAPTLLARMIMANEKMTQRGPGEEYELEEFEDVMTQWGPGEEYELQEFEDVMTQWGPREEYESDELEDVMTQKLFGERIKPAARKGGIPQKRLTPEEIENLRIQITKITSPKGASQQDPVTSL